MATPNKDDPKKNPEPHRAGTDINKNVAKVEEVSEEEQQKEDEEKNRKEYAARMDYATKVHGGKDRSFIESEGDWECCDRLIAEGFAELRAEQVHMETRNWIELTPEGIRAVQAYNSKTD